MANEQNLKSLKDRTTEEKREIAIKGGIASGEARREKRDLRKALEALLEKDYSDKKGNVYSGAEKLAVNLFEKALEEGDTAKAARAFEVIRDTAGQKPIDKIDQTTTHVVVDLSDLEDDDND